MTTDALMQTAIKPLLTADLQTFCKAAGDELRLDILRVLSRDTFGVLELAQLFETTQPGMSHHLKILSQAGLVVSRREGNSVFYRRADRAAASELDALQTELLRVIDRLPISANVQHGLGMIRAERAQRSRHFFTENASAFRLQQEQIVSYDVYGPAMTSLIDSHFQGQHNIAIEVGPGEGHFLGILASRFAETIGIDNASEMLEQAKNCAQQLELTNVHFLESDTNDADIKAGSVDCVVVNMVLHHTPSPASLFEDFHRWLNQNGELYLTELCLHDQDWVQNACGDIWLGFDPDELTQWATTAGFISGHSVFLTQRNGFCVQLRQFLKATP